MSHLTDADLVLYRQDEAPDRERIAAHLAACERCRTELDVLGRVLALVETDAAPVRDADYGAAVWNAIEARLDAPAPRARSWPTTWRGGCGGGAAGGARRRARRAPARGRSTAMPACGSSRQPRERPVLVAAVEDHLERTGLMLTELNNVQDGSDVQRGPRVGRGSRVCQPALSAIGGHRRRRADRTAARRSRARAARGRALARWRARHGGGRSKRCAAGSTRAVWPSRCGSRARSCARATGAEWRPRARRRAL